MWKRNVFAFNDYLDNKETQREVREAIDSLSPERRSALIMFYYENMKMKDIAATMDINENAVAHRLTEARKQICKRLKGYAGKSFVCVPLPLVLGACVSLQGEPAVLDFAFGVVAMVAMTPLITIQSLGFKSVLSVRRRDNAAMRRILAAADDQIIYFE